VTYPKKKDGLLVIGDPPRWKNGLVVMGDLPEWKNGLIVIGTYPGKKNMENVLVVKGDLRRKKGWSPCNG
jgi:hypothetical protein